MSLPVDFTKLLSVELIKVKNKDLEGNVVFDNGGYNRILETSEQANNRLWDFSAIVDSLMLFAEMHEDEIDYLEASYRGHAFQGNASLYVETNLETEKLISLFMSHVTNEYLL